MRILWLCKFLPYPPVSGTNLREYHLLRGAAQQHEVTLLAFGQHAAEIPAPLKELCREVITRDSPPEQTGARRLMGFVSPKPREVFDAYSPALAARIRADCARGAYDLVIAAEWASTAYLDAFAGVPTILDCLELAFFESLAVGGRTWRERGRTQVTLWKLRAHLRRMLPRVAACTNVSEEETRLLSRAAPGYERFELIPNGVNLADYGDVSERPQRHSLIFTGPFNYLANYDAMQWFLGDIYPRVRAQEPEARLTITGAHGDLPLPCEEGVTRTGLVPDVLPLIAAARASIAPLRLGGGSRLKVLEAMALRTPVIATSKAVKGLEVVPGEDVLVADRADTFADATLRLLRDDSLRERMAARAYALLRERYEWGVILPRFLDVIERAAHGA